MNFSETKYSLLNCKKKGAFVRYSSFILLLHLLGLQIGLAETKAQPVTDSVTFSILAETFKTNADSAGMDRAAAQFFEKASQLKEVHYQGQAAGLISKSYFQKQNRQLGESWYTNAQASFKKNANILEAGKLDLAVGTLLTEDYDFEIGLPYLLKSADHFRKAKAYNELAKAYLSLSLSFHDFGNYGKGIAYANQALEVLEANKNVLNKNLFWYAYNDLGINYDDSKQPLNAITAHQKALLYAANASDSSYSLNNLGNTYKKTGNYAEAEKYFNLSLQKATDYSDQYHLATIYSNMVDIYRLNKNYLYARRFIDSAFYYAKQSGSPEKLLDINYYTYLLKKETGDYKDAVTYLHDHLNLKDSFFTAEKNKAVLKYQALYETEKKEGELAATQLSLAKARLTSSQKDLFLLVAAFLLAAIITALVYFRNKARYKQKHLAAENLLLQEKAAAEVQNQRLEIAHNLHDSIGAQLTLIGSMTDQLLYDKSYNQQTNEKLRKLSNLCDGAVAELKNALWVMNEKEIYLEDLRMKFLNFMNQVAEAEETIFFLFNFTIVKNTTITSQQAIHLMRLIQELTNNALKHSGGTEVRINLIQDENSLGIHFSDNGKGFRIREGDNNSYGLKTIQKRVRELNGKMNLESTTRGTRYSIVMPFT